MTNEATRELLKAAKKNGYNRVVIDERNFYCYWKSPRMCLEFSGRIINGYDYEFAAKRYHTYHVFGELNLTPGEYDLT